MISKIHIRNFRRLEDVSIDLEKKETVFVGPNNSGKTSATAIFGCFLARRKFSLYDFSVSKITDFNAFGNGGDAKDLPAIELDLWFKIDPSTIEFGRAFTLVPNLTDNFEELGVRLRYGVADSEKLREEYFAAYPKIGDSRAKGLAEFISLDGNLKHFDISYYSLQRLPQEIKAIPIAAAEGRSLLQNLIRIDFVNAQRNIDDDESHRSNRLSNAFASFYSKNLEVAQAAADAHRVIDENNKQLTDHYEKQFDPLMKMIGGLGVPSINDRSLKIVSTLNPETALRGNTDLLYVDAERQHSLPELYNGLGFKNLIYIAIQARHFHSQWVRTLENRPLCQLIFIEEPEVHLHAQVQQTFISNIWSVLVTSAGAENAEGFLPQLVITTHSSHVLDATEFAKIRYFRRCLLKGENPNSAKVLNATTVHSLRDFKPQAVTIEGQEASEAQALDFLKRFLRLTHCDLFFADAAILVEGSVEKLLLPSMMDKAAKKLSASYLTILEIGGAYAHRFDELMAFLSIPYLIITDLDSVSQEGRHPACRADTPNALTSNVSLKKVLNVSTVEQLGLLTSAQKSSDAPKRYVAFQTLTNVVSENANKPMLARTIEEAFAYQNFALLRSDDLRLGRAIPADLDGAYETIYQCVKSDNFKKTDFAMSVLASSAEWFVPSYIEEGLCWLETQLYPPQQQTEATQ